MSDKTWVFASNNAHKLKEIREKLPFLEIKSLADINCFDEIEETGSTLEENARIKSSYVFEKYGFPCFSDDTGLEVEALNGEPGVYSARYAGEEATFSDNVNKLLRELEGKENRKAQFRTVISLRDGKTEQLFEGLVLGEITTEAFGGEGFGYDPVFKPLEKQNTFAEMSINEKNKISHRARAVEKLIKFIQNYK